MKINPIQKNVIYLVLFLLSSTLLIAEGEQQNAEAKGSAHLNQEQTIDSIYTTQKKMKKTQDKIYETIKNEPLEDKKYGIDLNPFRLLFVDESIGALSGGFSIFNNKKDIEHYFSLFAGSESPTIFSLDYHYRNYLGNSLNGLYICGFTRYEQLSGNYYTGYEQDEEVPRHFGLGFGVGYKVFSYKGFFWGINLGFGRYIIGNFDDNEVIWNFEVLKFGWAF